MLAPRQALVDDQQAFVEADQSCFKQKLCQILCVAELEAHYPLVHCFIRAQLSSNAELWEFKQVIGVTHCQTLRYVNENGFNWSLVPPASDKIQLFRYIDLARSENIVPFISQLAPCRKASPFLATSFVDMIFNYSCSRSLVPVLPFLLSGEYGETYRTQGIKKDNKVREAALSKKLKSLSLENVDTAWAKHGRIERKEELARQLDGKEFTYTVELIGGETASFHIQCPLCPQKVITKEEIYQFQSHLISHTGKPPRQVPVARPDSSRQASPEDGQPEAQPARDKSPKRRTSAGRKKATQLIESETMIYMTREPLAPANLPPPLQHGEIQDQDLEGE